MDVTLEMAEQENSLQAAKHDKSDPESPRGTILRYRGGGVLWDRLWAHGELDMSSAASRTPKSTAIGAARERASCSMHKRQESG